VRVLIACEFSGIVRSAFRARGHEAWSCDLLQSDPMKCSDCRVDMDRDDRAHTCPSCHRVVRLADAGYTPVLEPTWTPAVVRVPASGGRA
jgi:hypothetical protein